MGMGYVAIDEGIINSFVLRMPTTNQILKAEICGHSLKEAEGSQLTVLKHSCGWLFIVIYETPI